MVLFGLAGIPCGGWMNCGDPLGTPVADVCEDDVVAAGAKMMLVGTPSPSDAGSTPVGTRLMGGTELGELLTEAGDVVGGTALVTAAEVAIEDCAPAGLGVTGAGTADVAVLSLPVAVSLLAVMLLASVLTLLAPATVGGTDEVTAVGTTEPVVGTSPVEVEAC